MPDVRASPSRWAGLLCLGAGAGAAAALAARHLGAGALPGCGLESACDRLLASPWAALPGVRWPLAFLGASWFLALGGAWFAARPGWPGAFRWLARGGALASLGLLGAMLQERALCPYCLLAHAASLAFLLFSEKAARVSGPARLPWGVFAVLFLGANLAFLPPWLGHERGLRAQDERELAGSTRALTSGEAPETSAPFTGRYRLGPEDAPLRLVFFSDYQCRDCQRLEGEAQALLARRDDLALSVKHYPLSSECNARARELGANPHPEACRAARAAEAAGIAGGEAGFWALHRWLFEHGGVFREDAGTLAALGLSGPEFLAAFRGEEVRRRVEADVEEALRLGVTSTPLIFLNGVELRGWRAPRALERAVEALAATQPPRATAASDRPPAALEKCLEDWRREPQVLVPAPGRAGGAAPRAQEIVLWGDYFDPATRALERELRAALGAERAALYSFRHFPLDSACDAKVPAQNPGACLAARAVEAAFALGGEPIFRAFHARVMESEGEPSASSLTRLAAELGLDPDAFAAALAAESTLASVSRDIANARRLGVTSIPALFVERRRVPRWRLEGEPLIERILAEALEGR